ncbi:hypothetical protein MITS9509_00211 [Synechococcus sp. MIT S9509]|nr:hypothetical protein MITS9509_00211 [Synechococcus sp. MIT S9509]
MGMKLTRALMAGFVKKQHPWIRIFTSTLDALITALINDAMQFSLEVGNILEQLIFFAVVVSVVKANKPPRVDTLELTCDEAFDIPLQIVGLLSLLLLY